MSTQRHDVTVATRQERRPEAILKQISPHELDAGLDRFDQVVQPPRSDSARVSTRRVVIRCSP